jgi:hypothetical protein
MTTIYGLDDVSLTEKQTVWEQSTGSMVREVYKGPREKAEDKFDDLLEAAEDNDAIRLTVKNGMGTVEVTYQDEATVSEEENETWEVQADPLEKPLESFGGRAEDANAQQFNKDADQAGIQFVRERFESGDRQLVPSIEPALTYSRLLARGVNHYRRSGCVLVRHLIITSTSELAASWSGVDRAQQIATDDGPNPPVAIIGAISEMPDYDEDKKQWLKNAPQIRQLSRGTYDVVQSWQFAKRWSYTLYGGDVEADGSNP